MEIYIKECYRLDANGNKTKLTCDPEPYNQLEIINICQIRLSTPHKACLPPRIVAWPGCDSNDVKYTVNFKKTKSDLVATLSAKKENNTTTILKLACKGDETEVEKRVTRPLNYMINMVSDFQCLHNQP